MPTKCQDLKKNEVRSSLGALYRSVQCPLDLLHDGLYLLHDGFTLPGAYFGVRFDNFADFGNS